MPFAGSGKTHTMTGMRHQPDGLGINYRALDDLFALRNERRTEVCGWDCQLADMWSMVCCMSWCLTFACPSTSAHSKSLILLSIIKEGLVPIQTPDFDIACSSGAITNCCCQVVQGTEPDCACCHVLQIKYTIKAQMLEIYNDNVRDLLAFNQGKDNVLSINATLRSGFNVTGAVQMEVHDTQGVLEMMDRGAKNRHSAETKMNRHSSRSHQVLTIIVDSENIISKAATHACLHLVDLAGSERILKSGAVGES